jgi:hypothetical protein
MYTNLCCDEDEDKTVQSVIDGTNRRIRILPLTKETWVNTFQGDERWFGPDRKHTSDLKLVKIQVGTVNRQTVWLQLVAKLHRPLPVDGEVLSAEVCSRKIGLRIHTDLNIVVKLPSKSRHTGRKIQITPTAETTANGLKIASWSDDSGRSGECFLDQIKSGKHTFQEAMDQVAELEKHVQETTKACGEIIATKSSSDFPDDKELQSFLHQNGKYIGLPTRSSLRRAFRLWLYYLRTQHGEKCQEQLRILRKEGRDCMAKKKDFFNAVDRVAFKAMVIKGLSLKSKSQAETFAALLMFTARYDHLAGWSANLREKALRRRRHEYRNLVAGLLRDAQSVTVVVDDLRARRLSDDQKTACQSQLVLIVKNYADREGLSFAKQKPKTEPKAADKIAITQSQEAEDSAVGLA